MVLPVSVGRNDTKGRPEAAFVEKRTTCLSARHARDQAPLTTRGRSPHRCVGVPQPTSGRRTSWCPCPGAGRCRERAADRSGRPSGPARTKAGCCCWAQPSLPTGSEAPPCRAVLPPESSIAVESRNTLPRMGTGMTLRDSPLSAHGDDAPGGGQSNPPKEGFAPPHAPISQAQPTDRGGRRGDQGRFRRSSPPATPRRPRRGGDRTG